jgi:Uma2 family endonuclease
VQCGHGATVRLSDSAEPQPDIFLRILPECGGQSNTDDNFVVGPPELVAEIAHSSWALDLGEKYEDYCRNGVKEYLVLDLNDRVLHWFDLSADTELSPEADGIIRAKQFPGLWLHAASIIAGDFPTMRATLESGMATNEYKQFVERLAAAREKN